MTSQITWRLPALFCMLRWIQFESQESVLNFLRQTVHAQVATSSTFPSANYVIRLCWILDNKPRIVATFFFQRTATVELFLYNKYLHFRFLVFGKQKLKISVLGPYLFDSLSFTVALIFHT